LSLRAVLSIFGASAAARRVVRTRRRSCRKMPLQTAPVRLTVNTERADLFAD
jgi:hypothetical protein